jgi:hypothetical protein
MRWWRHPLEAFLWWLRGYDEPGWRWRLWKPFHEEWMEFQWATEKQAEKLMRKGWEFAGVHPVHDLPGRKSVLMKRRIR